MPQLHLDRRPGTAPPAPPAPKGARFPGLSRPRSKFFDLPTTAFLLAASWLFFYTIDRLCFEGNGTRAFKTGVAMAKEFVQR